MIATIFKSWWGNLFSVLVFSALLFCHPQLLTAYNGQEPTDAAAPRLFLPGIVSTHLGQRDAALSPDGRLFMYTLTSYTRQVIVFVEQGPMGWEPPRVAAFSGTYSDLEPHFSPDGNTLYFASNRPLEAGGPTKDFDIWYVLREGGCWGKPVNMGFPINTPADEFYPSITNEGTLYWCAKREDGLGGEDIFFSRLQDGKYREVTALPGTINTPADEYNAYVARDESYIIFTSTGHGRGHGSGDLWISFRKPDGSWAQTINMGPEINAASFEFCPFVSEDGRQLFFTSNRMAEASISPVTYADIESFAGNPGNKLHSIYVMDAKVIEALRKAAMGEPHDKGAEQ